MTTIIPTQGLLPDYDRHERGRSVIYVVFDFCTGDWNLSGVGTLYGTLSAENAWGFSHTNCHASHRGIASPPKFTWGEMQRSQSKMFEEAASAYCERVLRERLDRILGLTPSEPGESGA